MAAVALNDIQCTIMFFTLVAPVSVGAASESGRSSVKLGIWRIGRMSPVASLNSKGYQRLRSDFSRSAIPDSSAADQ